MKNQRGITIITLVVTIIILIILAGVSINMLLGESGIITKTKEATKLQEIASIKEEIKLKILEQEIETKGNVTQSEIETILSNYGTVNKNEDGTINSLTPTGKDYEIAYEEIYIYVTSEGENSGESADDGTNSGTETGSDADTVTLTREEYNSIIERLDAIDGGSKTSVSIADVATNMSTMQDNLNSSISDINTNLAKTLKPETINGTPNIRSKAYIKTQYNYNQITEIMNDIAWDLGSTTREAGLVVCTVTCSNGIVSILYSPNGTNYGAGFVLNYSTIMPFRIRYSGSGVNTIIFGNAIIN